MHPAHLGCQELPWGPPAGWVRGALSSWDTSTSLLLVSTARGSRETSYMAGTEQVPRPSPSWVSLDLAFDRHMPAFSHLG